MADTYTAALIVRWLRMGGKEMDLTSNYLQIRVRYDAVTIAMITACALFLAWAAWKRRKL